MSGNVAETVKCICAASVPRSSATIRGMAQRGHEMPKQRNLFVA
jgi:hypothetical protein